MTLTNVANSRRANSQSGLIQPLRWHNLTVSVILLVSMVFAMEARATAMTHYQSANDSVYFADLAIEGSHGSVTLCLKNALSISEIVVPLAFFQGSTFARLDSMTWTARLANPLILPNRIIQPQIDGFSPDFVLIWARTPSSQVLPAGRGEIARLYFTSDSIGLFRGDTTSLFPTMNLRLVDSVGLVSTPSFITADFVCLDEDLIQRWAHIIYPDDSMPILGDSATISGSYRGAAGDTLPNGDAISADSVVFSYSYDNLSYFRISSDLSGMDDCMRSDSIAPCSGDGWAATIDVANLVEGWGFIRMLAYLGPRTYGDTTKIYFFPEPPTVRILSPTFGSGVSDSLHIQAQVHSARHSWIADLFRQEAKKEYTKGVELCKQFDLVGNELGSSSCAPTAVTSCLLYWANHGYPDLAKSKDGSKDLSPKEVCGELSSKMGTGKDGTAFANMVDGTKQYIDERPSLKDKFEIKRIPKENSKNYATFKDIKEQLEKDKEDVIGMMRDSTGQKRHAITFNSVSNDGSQKVGFMDPWRGQMYPSSFTDGATATTPGSLKFGFKETQGDWEVVRLLIVSEKPTNQLIPTPIAKTGRHRVRAYQDTIIELSMSIFDQPLDSIYFASVILTDSVSGFKFSDYITYFRVPSTSCCIGFTGNIDCDPEQECDISDLSALIDYLYITFTPLCCTEEANTDGQPGIDISDLSALIDYLYIGFTPPAACQ